MQRSSRLGGLLGLAVVAAWLGSSHSLVRALRPTDEPGAQAGEKSLEEDKGPPRISVLRLQVIKPEPAQANMPAGFPRRHRFGFDSELREGTSLTFTLDEPQRTILGVETTDCKITSFRDDRGTDLTSDEAEPARGNMPMNPQFEQENGPFLAEVDQAGHRATFTVHSPRLPTGGANRLLLEVILAVKYARG